MVRNRNTKKVRKLTRTEHGNQNPWVTLSRTDTDGCRIVQTVRVDKLVAGVWVGKPTKRKPHLAHVDGNRRNCGAANLEYRAHP